MLAAAGGIAAGVGLLMLVVMAVQPGTTTRRDHVAFVVSPWGAGVSGWFP